MILTRRQLEEDVVEYSRRLHASGWVANYEGNVSARLADDRFLISPDSMFKGCVCRDMLLVVDSAGNRVSGTKQPFQSLDLHLQVYRARPDVRAVVHAHPPTASGLSLAGIEIRAALLAEAVISLGATIPVMPYAPIKSEDFATRLSHHVIGADAIVLEHHGVLTYGVNLEVAFAHLELVEHLAKIQLVGMQAGTLRELPSHHVAPLLDARAERQQGEPPRPPPASSNVSPIRVAHR